MSIVEQYLQRIGPKLLFVPIGSLIGRQKDCKKSGIIVGLFVLAPREYSMLTTNSFKLE
jgi:hypothetical protein